jgi:hypothetical protein
MDFFERDLEDIIYNVLQGEDGYDSLNERGLDICYSPDHFICKRQLKIGNYGIADLVTLSRFTQGGLFIEVIELKKGEVNMDAYVQANRYLTGIKRYVERFHPKLMVVYSITLIGRHINRGDWVYLIDQVENLKVLTYKYDIDGITFESHSGYVLRDEGLIKVSNANPF